MAPSNYIKKGFNLALLGDWVGDCQGCRKEMAVLGTKGEWCDRWCKCV